jgi:hypothetical protein
LKPGHPAEAFLMRLQQKRFASTTQLQQASAINQERHDPPIAE